MISLKRKDPLDICVFLCFIFLRNVRRSKTQDDSTKVMTPFSYPRLYCSILNICKHATCCCDGNVPEQKCRLQVGCLLVNQIKGGDLLLFT